MCICKHCGKECRNLNSLRQHEIRCKENPDHIEYSPICQKGNPAWNRGLTKETDPRIQQSVNTLKKKFESGELTPSFLGKHHTEESKRKLAKSGGYRKGSGIGKHGWYKGFYCDSSWELAFVVYNLEHNIKLIRNKERFPYVFNGKNYYYIPDFIIDDTLIEIKGYKDLKWKAKHNQFPKDRKLVVLEKNEMKPYLDYVIEKYGKNFIDLYES